MNRNYQSKGFVCNVTSNSPIHIFAYVPIWDSLGAPADLSAEPVGTRFSASAQFIAREGGIRTIHCARGGQSGQFLAYESEPCLEATPIGLMLQPQPVSIV